MPRVRSVAWLLPLALIALTCAREPRGVRRAIDAFALCRRQVCTLPDACLPTSVARIATPVAPTPVSTRYLGRCAGSVCELLTAAESRVAPPSDVRENWTRDFTRVVVETRGSASAGPVPARDLDQKPLTAVGRLFTVRDLDGSSRVVGAAGSAQREAAAVWSPDGSLLAVENPVSGEGIGLPESIEIVRADGSGGWTLIAGELEAENSRSGSSPTWSPDGREIAFTLFVGAGPGAIDEGIFVSWADGSNPHRVATTRLRPIRVSWLPGGQLVLLAYVRPDAPQPPRDPGPPPDLFVVNPDGSELRRLTEGGAYVDGDGRRPLVVSPDGRCIAYRTTNYADLVGELGVTCLDGSSSQITRDRIGEPPSPGLSGYYTWLTDGRLAVLSTAECAGLLAVRVETEERECIVY